MTMRRAERRSTVSPASRTGRPLGVLLTAILIFGARPSSAQVPGITYERILLPIQVSRPQPGNLGSMWMTHLMIANTAEVPVNLYPFQISNDGLMGGVGNDQFPIPPNLTTSIVVAEDTPPRRGRAYPQRS